MIPHDPIPPHQLKNYHFLNTPFFNGKIKLRFFGMLRVKSASSYFEIGYCTTLIYKYKVIDIIKIIITSRIPVIRTIPQIFLKIFSGRKISIKSKSKNLWALPRPSCLKNSENFIDH